MIESSYLHVKLNCIVFDAFILQCTEFQRSQGGTEKCTLVECRLSMTRPNQCCCCYFCSIFVKDNVTTCIVSISLNLEAYSISLLLLAPL